MDFASFCGFLMFFKFNPFKNDIFLFLQCNAMVIIYEIYLEGGDYSSHKLLKISWMNLSNLIKFDKEYYTIIQGFKGTLTGLTLFNK